MIEAVALARIASDARHIVCGHCGRGVVGWATFDFTQDNVARYRASQDPMDYFRHTIGTRFEAPIGWALGAEGIWEVSKYSRNRRARQREEDRRKRKGDRPRAAIPPVHNKYGPIICPDCGKLRKIVTCDCAECEHNHKTMERPDEPALKFRSGKKTSQGFTLPVPCQIRCDACQKVSTISTQLLENTPPPMPEHEEPCYELFINSLPDWERGLRKRSYYNELVYTFRAEQVVQTVRQFTQWQNHTLGHGIAATWGDYWDWAAYPATPEVIPIDRDMSLVLSEDKSKMHLVAEARPFWVQTSRPEYAVVQKNEESVDGTQQRTNDEEKIPTPSTVYLA